MKNKFLIIIAIIAAIIVSVAIIEIVTENKEPYVSSEITGIKHAYKIGEPISFTETVQGYYLPCVFPDYEILDETTMEQVWKHKIVYPCPFSKSPQEFRKINIVPNGNIASPIINQTGQYILRSYSSYPDKYDETEFSVVEKMCDSSDLKERVQCISDSFDSCISSYMQTTYPTVEGDPIYITGIVESWNDCKLLVYEDTIHDRFGDKNSSAIKRSYCKDIVVKEDYWTITGCDNFDIPPRIEY